MTAEWKLIQGHCWVTAYKCNGAPTIVTSKANDGHILYYLYLRKLNKQRSDERYDLESNVYLLLQARAYTSSNNKRE